MSASSLVSVRAPLDPARAFRLFVEKIGDWWRPDELFEITSKGDGRLSFEEGSQGRLITTLGDGEVFEIGRILEWSPPERLSFAWRQANFAPEMVTRVDVTFVGVEEETRITVVHTGWTTIPRAHAARHRFPDQVTLMRAGEWWRRSMFALEARARATTSPL